MIQIFDMESVSPGDSMMKLIRTNKQAGNTRKFMLLEQYFQFNDVTNSA